MLMQKSTTNTPVLWDDSVRTSPLRISNWIDEIFDEALNWPHRSNGNFTPELNVYETDKEFEIALALPGMNKSDFEISYNNGMLTISGERKMDAEENGRRYHRVESRFGKFSRTMPLPADLINEDKISARYENGVLNVTIPKSEEKAAKRIKVH